MFHVGQLVVCVDVSEDQNLAWLPGDAPTKGMIYTVAKVGLGKSGRLVVALAEKPRHPVSSNLGYWGYRATRFRPVNDSALDIFRKTEAPTPTERESA